MNEILYWLAALRLPGVGAVTLRRGLDHFANMPTLFSAGENELMAAGFTLKQAQVMRNPDLKAAQQDLLWMEKHQCRLILLTDSCYPTLLREIHDPPLLLFVRGNAELLTEPQLAIVGSRHPTVAGIALAEQFAKQLAASGLVITSGLALGIDAASHQGSLSGNGKTLAVLGTGLSHIYPRSHQKLADTICEQGGALISEFPPGTLPKPMHFPLRNRIISGLSLGVLVVEAAIRSGSLITARLAMEQNREVFAIPGSIHNPMARGCHQLLRQGAKLVETADDVLEELGALYKIFRPENEENKQKISTLAKPAAHLQQVFTQIGYEATSLDVIILRSGLTSGQVSSMLLSLEMEGYIQMVPGGYTRCVSI